MSFSKSKNFLRIVSIPSKNLEYSLNNCTKLYNIRGIFTSPSSTIEITLANSNKYNETEQLLRYTRTKTNRKPRVPSNLINEPQKTEPSKYFQFKKLRHVKKDISVEPAELYPEDYSKEVYEGKINENEGKKQYRENFKLKDSPVYKVEHRRDNESQESMFDYKEINDLKNEYLDFVNKEEKDLQSIETVPSEQWETVDFKVDRFNFKNFVKELNAIPGPLDECKEDLSSLGPVSNPTYNFAAYADNSKLIQTFTNLGVNLFKVEKNQDHMRALLTVNLETEFPMYIQFLHDCGIPADNLGDVITENPLILKEDLDDMKTRIKYLKAHDFSNTSIGRIVTKNPSWLCWATKCIDERLGHFQTEFKLSGSELRFLATKMPKLITYKFKQIHENTFAFREQMGFTKDEVKVLLLSKPRLWMNSRKKIVDTFDYLHNTMNLSHLMIASQSEIMTCRKCRLKNRHEFLVELKKAQYNPKNPGYIAPRSVAVGSDEEFCRDIANVALDTYNLFLKTR